jgi:hypothetical protein
MDVQNDVREHIKRKIAALYALLTNWSGILEGYAKQNAPWKDRMGHSRQSIHSGVEKNEDKFVLYLSHGQAHGTYLEKGTGIYGPKGRPIKPVTKKALYWPGAPHPVKEVKGMKAKPIIGPTIEAHIDRIRDSVHKLWRD